MSAVLARKAVPIVILVLMMMMGLSGEWFRILLSQHYFRSNVRTFIKTYSDA